MTERQHLKDIVYLRTSIEISKLSTCQFTSVGAVLVDANGYVRGVSYNGTPSNISHCTAHEMTRDEHLQYANDYEIHAEMNLMLSIDSATTKGATVYTNISPCNNCLKHMAQKGIKRVVTSSIYWRSSEEEVSNNCNKYGIEFSLINVEQ